MSLANSAIFILPSGIAGVRAVERHFELADHRAAQVFRRRLLRTGQELLAIDDLHDAAAVGAVGEDDAVVLHAGRDHAVQVGRHGAGRAGLLADQTEIADIHRLRRIAEIVDLGLPARAPVLQAGNEVGDAGVALPPVLVGVHEVGRDGADLLGIGRIGDVPDFVRLVAEHAQHVDRVADRPWAACVPSQMRTICAPPCSPSPSSPGICARYFGCSGSVTSMIEVPLNSACLVSRIDRLRHRIGAAVMADIGDVAVALLVDDRLVGAARLQVVVADQAHVLGFGRSADALLLLRHRRHRRERGQSDGRGREPSRHACRVEAEDARVHGSRLPDVCFRRLARRRICRAARISRYGKP